MFSLFFATHLLTTIETPKEITNQPKKQHVYSRRKKAKKVSSNKLKAIFSPTPELLPLNESSLVGTSTPTNIWAKSKTQRRKSLSKRVSEIQSQLIVESKVIKRPLFTQKRNSVLLETIKADDERNEPKVFDTELDLSVNERRSSSSVILLASEYDIEPPNAPVAVSKYPKSNPADVAETNRTNTKQIAAKTSVGSDKDLESNPSYPPLPKKKSITNKSFSTTNNAAPFPILHPDDTNTILPTFEVNIKRNPIDRSNKARINSEIPLDVGLSDLDSDTTMFDNDSSIPLNLVKRKPYIPSMATRKFKVPRIIQHPTSDSIDLLCYDKPLYIIRPSPT